jgi:PAS domain S-box-containing protein
VEATVFADRTPLAMDVSTAQFKQIFESLPGRYLILDRSFDIVAVSDAYLETTMTTRSGILGRNIFEVFPENPEQPAGGVAKLRESLSFVRDKAQADTMLVTKYDIPRPEGGFEERYWSPVNTPVLGPRGEVLFIVHRVEDITEVVALEARGNEMERELLLRARAVEEVNARLRSANEELEQRAREKEALLERTREVDKLKTAFFTNVSHELRTPVALILGTLEAGQASGLDQNQLHIALRSARRLLKLVSTMLDFSRIEAGHLDVVFVPTDLAQFTRLVASAFRVLIEDAGLEFELSCERLSEPVYVDRDAYEKIVLNLISNAYKYTLQGRIAVRLSQVEGRARLVVEDTGSGIREEELPRVFERFYRASRGAARSIEGAGIGLALVSELVRMHGGTVYVESEAEQGSRFVVELPLGHAHLPHERVQETAPVEDEVAPAAAGSFLAEAEAWRPEPRARATPARRPGMGARVLVADDNVDMREYLDSLLRPYFDVETVADGRDALEAARRHVPDTIVADIMMPRVDGLALIDALRENDDTRAVPVLLLSARSGEEARVKGLRTGADDYLVKPFSASELIERVQTLVERARRQREVEEENRRKDEFLAILGHELRNPLAPLRMGLDLLAMDPQVAASRRATGRLRAMRRQAQSLTRILDDLLDISRISTGQLELRVERVDLREVVNAAATLVRGLVDERQHELVLALPDSPIWVEVDPVRMEQVLGNLLTNAVKFTPNGGRIAVEMRSGDGEVELRVRDNGVGLEPNQRERVFELFERGRRSPGNRSGGLGIGLSLARRIVELHEGQLEAASEGRDRGTEMIVRLAVDPDPAPAVEPRAHGPAVAHTEDHRRLRVLVVDDATDTADMLAELVSAWGHESRAVYHPDDALAELERFRPDVAFLDLGLPDMDGYELARRIRSTDESPRLVAITGYGQPADRARSRRAGFAAHLVKPASPGEVSELLVEISAGRSPN